MTQYPLTQFLLWYYHPPQGTSFVWPTSGPVKPATWDPSAECGNGLHGWKGGEGTYRHSLARAREVEELRLDKLELLGFKVR